MSDLYMYTCVYMYIHTHIERDIGVCLGHAYYMHSHMCMCMRIVPTDVANSCALYVHTCEGVC